MSKLIIAADVHGFVNSWHKLRAKLEAADVLAIAGDLFSTRYPFEGDPNFNPELVRQEFQDLPNQKYYVYGNCDDQYFFPGHKFVELFKFQNQKILLSHGDLPVNSDESDIIISGHTHIPEIKNSSGKILVNPGSAAKPRGIGKNSKPTYAVLEQGKVEIKLL